MRMCERFFFRSAVLWFKRTPSFQCSLSHALLILPHLLSLCNPVYPTVSNHRNTELLSPFYFRQSRPPPKRDGSLARSLARLTVHSPVLLSFVVVVAHETYSVASSNIHRRTVSINDLTSVAIYDREARNRTARTPDECTDGGYRPSSENSTLTRKHRYAIIKLVTRTHTYIHTTHTHAQETHVYTRLQTGTLFNYTISLGSHYNPSYKSA